jgi:carbamoyltransferase
MPSLTLGISAYYHDSAAALLCDGKILAAAQEERFSRKRHDAAFPNASIKYCLQAANVQLHHIEHVVFYDKPLLKFERLLETYIAFAPKGFGSFRIALPSWLREKLFLKDLLCKELSQLGNVSFSPEQLLFSEHHLSHAASAFYPSPFESSVVLTMDGVGEWATTSVSLGQGNQLKILEELHFPHSLGLLYSAFTYYTGFKVNSGEYKVMGLAPYGRPIYVQTILDHLIDLKPDGSFRLDMDYFDYCTGLTMTNQRFNALFGAPPRQPESTLTQRDMDLAASVQAVVEEAMCRLVRHAVKSTGISRVCLAGGVALNCVGNGKILRQGITTDLWIQPAAGDAGGALGAAYIGYHLHRNKPRATPSAPDDMQGGFLGPSFTQEVIEQRLLEAGAIFEVLGEDQLIATCAKDLAEGKALGWFQGRMEFGPRALGARSILADPRSPETQRVLNQKVKFRESFRPFAPSVLSEHLSDWFDLDVASPYMLLTAPVAKKRLVETGKSTPPLQGIDLLHQMRSEIPAVTHVDNSARVQTVHSETNPAYHRLLSAFHDLTGCPVLANTSFNVRGEPIVCSPEDAFKCFMGSHIETLAIGRCLLRKSDQSDSLHQQYEHLFDLD